MNRSPEVRVSLKITRPVSISLNYFPSRNKTLAKLKQRIFYILVDRILPLQFCKLSIRKQRNPSAIKVRSLSVKPG